MDKPNPSATRQPKTIVVTAFDNLHFDLAEDLFESIFAVRTRAYDLGFVQMCDAPLPAGLARSDIQRVQRIGPPANEIDGYVMGFLNIKASLPQLFPDYDCYIWLDGDCWVQNEDWFAALLYGAARADICIHPEYDIHYTSHRTPNNRTLSIYAKNYSVAEIDVVCRFPMVNAGVFAAMATSPLWAAWSQEMQRLMNRHNGNQPAYFSDQIPLHYLLNTGRLKYSPLRAVHNWLSFACPPMLHRQRGTLVTPIPPHEDLSIIHLAGLVKDQTIEAFGGTLRYREMQDTIRRFRVS